MHLQRHPALRRTLCLGGAGSLFLVTALVALLTVASSNAVAGQREVVTRTGVHTHGAITTTPYTIGWLLECGYSHSLADDPVLKPGAPGASHRHDFFGNVSTAAASTLSSQLAHGSSCTTSADTAAYWTPSLYIDGTAVRPEQTSEELYYRARYAAGVVVEPVPTDLRMVVGSMMASTPAQNPALASGAISWSCHDGTRSFAVPPVCGNDDELIENVVFPSCWDGTLTHADDSKHVAYAPDLGRCPQGFPHAMPRISLKVKYPGTTSRQVVTLASGSTATAHSDFWNTWQQAGLRYLVTNCLDAAISCGTNPIAPTGP